MHGRRRWAAVGSALIALLLAAPASAQFTPGARSLDDVYLPKLGNGGYDALHYDLTIDYDPSATRWCRPRTSRSRRPRGCRSSASTSAAST